MVGPQKSHEATTPSSRGLEAHAATLMAQALLSRATSLARLGSYDSAELVLSSLPRTLPEAVDLLAKIRAQQGRMRAAAELWTEALCLDPSNARYRSSLRRAEQGPWRRRSRPLLVAIVALFIVVAGGIAVRRLAHQRSQVATKIPREQPPAPAVAQKRIEISVPGVLQTTSGATTTLRFEFGLFSHGVLLTPGARASLQAIGRQIEPQWRRFSLTVIGHTDDLPIVSRQRFSDNEALAVARADTVIRYISTVSTIPMSAWSISRTPETQCLYACDSAAGRLRNRTVDLLIALGTTRKF
jgi:type VI secretion system protein ImpK